MSFRRCSLLGKWGGEPFGCILFDYWITNKEDDLELAEKHVSLGSSIDNKVCAIALAGEERESRRRTRYNWARSQRSKTANPRVHLHVYMQLLYLRSPDLVSVVFAGEGKRNEPEK
jgi:hypothetical protein